MVEYILSDQIYEDSELINHKGKKICAMAGDKNIGHIGYVDWNKGKYNNNLNTARLKVSGEIFDIYVDESFRRKGTGRYLFKELLRELKKEGFTQLIILGATQKAKGFYDKMLEDLLNDKEIDSFWPQEISESSDFIYDIKFHYEP